MEPSDGQKRAAFTSAIGLANTSLRVSFFPDLRSDSMGRGKLSHQYKDEAKREENEESVRVDSFG